MRTDRTRQESVRVSFFFVSFPLLYGCSVSSLADGAGRWGPRRLLWPVSLGKAVLALACDREDEARSSLSPEESVVSSGQYERKLVGAYYFQTG